MHAREKLHLAIIWHMHQPYYRDPESGRYMMPWVRLHGIKDYLDMVKKLESFPSLRMSFTLTPSLLEQIQEYAEGQASDIYLEISRKDTSSLQETDRIFLLENFFHANRATMIEPYPRYFELLTKRGFATDRESLKRALEIFSESDYRDLAVWFNLSWFDPLFREKDPFLIGLLNKGRNFTEEEKNLLLDIQRKILGEIIPAYREAMKRGQIEVLTVPYFHPILPLIIDTDIARESTPEITLPLNRFRYPRDARKHIELSLEQYRMLFGINPEGMWPSEGAVSFDVARLAVQAGLKFIATDEDILALSLGEPVSRDGAFNVENVEFLYRPYCLNVDGRKLNIVFRDHVLSDLIGFNYAGVPAKKAVEDFMRRLGEIYCRARSRKTSSRSTKIPLLVTVILDGENCWEYYPRDGHDFLDEFYGALSVSDFIKTTTVSEYLSRYGENLPELPKLFAGSWINHNFKIWIGHREDNAAWDMLYNARAALADFERRLAEKEAGRNGDSVLTEEPGRMLEMARREILIAEGSDWCWWYGDEHSSALDREFDELYRKHIAGVYRFLKLPVPPEVNFPIPSGSAPKIYEDLAPVVFISPKIDGRKSYFYEWDGAVRLEPRCYSTMHRSEELIEAVYYGFDLENFYIRIEPASSYGGIKTLEYEIEMKALEEVSLIFTPGCPPFLEKKIFGRVEKKEECNELIRAIEEFAEFAIPWRVAGLEPKTPFFFRIIIKMQGIPVLTVPEDGRILLKVPGEDFEMENWSL